MNQSLKDFKREGGEGKERRRMESRAGLFQVVLVGI